MKVILGICEIQVKCSWENMANDNREKNSEVGDILSSNLTDIFYVGVECATQKRKAISMIRILDSILH